MSTFKTNIENTMQPPHPDCALTFLLLFSCRPMKFFSMSHDNLHSHICKQKIVPRTIGNRTSVPHPFQCFWWQKYQFWFPRRSTTVAVHNLDRNCGWWILMGFHNAKHQQHNLTYPKIKDRTSCECLQWHIHAKQPQPQPQQWKKYTTHCNCLLTIVQLHHVHMPCPLFLSINQSLHALCIGQHFTDIFND